MDATKLSSKYQSSLTSYPANLQSSSLLTKSSLLGCSQSGLLDTKSRFSQLGHARVERSSVSKTESCLGMQDSKEPRDKKKDRKVTFEVGPKESTLVSSTLNTKSQLLTGSLSGTLYGSSSSTGLSGMTLGSNSLMGLSGTNLGSSSFTKPSLLSGQSKSRPTSHTSPHLSLTSSNLGGTAPSTMKIMMTSSLHSTIAPKVELTQSLKLTSSKLASHMCHVTTPNTNDLTSKPKRGQTGSRLTRGKKGKGSKKGIEKEALDAFNEKRKKYRLRL